MLPMTSIEIKDSCNDATLRVMRCSFTGEDGFLIQVPEKCTIELAERLSEQRSQDGKKIG
jgi:glycine cleavage system aminomethyltransferase T